MLAKVGSALSCSVNMYKCLFPAVWQLLLYGVASVRRARNIPWLTQPDYPRLLPFHGGSRLLSREESGVYGSVSCEHVDITAYT